MIEAMEHALVGQARRLSHQNQSKAMERVALMRPGRGPENGIRPDCGRML